MWAGPMEAWLQQQRQKQTNRSRPSVITRQELVSDLEVILEAEKKRPVMPPTCVSQLFNHT